jgi:hypothetical protein
VSVNRGPVFCEQAKNTVLDPTFLVPVHVNAHHGMKL